MEHNRLNFIPFIVTLLSILQISCQSQIQVAATNQKQTSAVDISTKQGPRITFDKVAHEFRDLVPRKQYACEFKFTNTGDSILKITGLKRCCGVVVKLDQREFAPGESGVIVADFLSGLKDSSMTRLIYVSSNDKENPEVALTLRAVVVPKVVCEPDKLNLVLDQENAGCPNIVITGLDRRPFSIKSFQSTGESITADLDQSVEATQFIIQPKVDLAKLELNSMGFININLTHPNCERITVYFNTLRRFQFKPVSIAVFGLESQKPILKKVYMISNYGEDFEIESANSEKGIARVTSQQAIVDGYSLTVEITPPEPDETNTFTDVLIVRLKGGEELAIKCYGQYTTKQR